MKLLSQAVSPLALLVFVQAAKGENLTKCVTSCQDLWEEMANRCYLWPEEKLSWEDAELFCNNLEGHLASVTDEKIHKYLRSKVNIDDMVDELQIDKDLKEKLKKTLKKFPILFNGGLGKLSDDFPKSTMKLKEGAKPHAATYYTFVITYMQGSR